MSSALIREIIIEFSCTLGERKGNKMRFGQVRHEIDRLHTELRQRVLQCATPDRKVYDQDQVNVILSGICREADRVFSDIVANLDHLEATVVETIVETVAKAYVEGKHGQS